MLVVAACAIGWLVYVKPAEPLPTALHHSGFAYCEVNDGMVMVATPDGVDQSGDHGMRCRPLAIADGQLICAHQVGSSDTAITVGRKEVAVFPGHVSNSAQGHPRGGVLTVTTVEPPALWAIIIGPGPEVTVQCLEGGYHAEVVIDDRGNPRFFVGRRRSDAADQYVGPGGGSVEYARPIASGRAVKRRCALSPDGTRLALVSSWSTITLRDNTVVTVVEAENWRRVSQFTVTAPPTDVGGFDTDISWDAEGRLLSLAEWSDGRSTVAVWDAESGRRSGEPAFDGMAGRFVRWGATLAFANAEVVPNCDWFAISPCGEIAAVASASHGVRLMDASGRSSVAIEGAQGGGTWIPLMASDG